MIDLPHAFDLLGMIQGDNRRMCLLGIAFRLNPDFPIMLLANREELYARPTAPPQIVSRAQESPAWIGGVDLVAGGTWLGVNESGLVIAVTNRAKAMLPASPLSRGVLCRSLLKSRETASALEVARRELESNQYAGCNLLIADRERAFVIEAGDSIKTTPLTAGLHLIANAELNPADDPRIRRVRRGFDRVDPASADEWFQEARRICQLTGEGDEPAIWLHGRDRGTVSSTVLGLGKDIQKSQYWHAPSWPAGTPYDDYTPLLEQILSGCAPEGIGLPFASSQAAFNSTSAPYATASAEAAGQPPAIEPPDDSPARRAVRKNLSWRVTDPVNSHDANAESSGLPGGRGSIYRFFLRGPWQSQPVARIERCEQGAFVWSGRALPAAETVRLPASWQDLFGTFRGRVRFRRRFHPPSNLESADRLFVVFDGIDGQGNVGLNGKFLGRTAPQAGTSAFEVTGQLRSNNELEIDLEYAKESVDARPGGLFAAVALEIRSPATPVTSD